MDDRPKFENAPGIRVRRRNANWEVFWRPRTDLVARGYEKTSQRLWVGREPTEADRLYVSDRATKMQSDMLVWGRGGIKQIGYDGTIMGLIRCYETDPDSPYHKLRYTPRLHSSRLCRIIAEHATVRIEDIRGRQVKHWHEEWSKRGVAMAHGIVGKLRTLLTFGSTILDDENCRMAKALLHDMRFPMSRPRTERLTAEQAVRIRAASHVMGMHSLALAQAFQFECMLRQKDVIGEWVPQSEPELSIVTRGEFKWLRGIRWSEVDDNLILRHVTSKKEKELVIDLKGAPMVIAELLWLAPGLIETNPATLSVTVHRGLLPTGGPVIVSENTAVPFEAPQFRAHWRKAADLAKVPRAVKNMDSRAGGISEATDAGAPIESVRHAATHSDTAMTQKYSRGSEEKIANVQRLRAEHRKNKSA